MKIRVFLHLFGSLAKLLALLLLIPGAVAAYYGEPGGVIAFALTALVTLAAGIVMSHLGTEEEMGIKEGLALVALG
jgi:Trk-type K+ transport system membrane component